MRVIKLVIFIVAFIYPCILLAKSKTIYIAGGVDKQINVMILGNEYCRRICDLKSGYFKIFDFEINKISHIWAHVSDPKIFREYVEIFDKMDDKIKIKARRPTALPPIMYDTLYIKTKSKNKFSKITISDLSVRFSNPQVLNNYLIVKPLRTNIIYDLPDSLWVVFEKEGYVPEVKKAKKDTSGNNRYTIDEAITLKEIRFIATCKKDYDCMRFSWKKIPDDVFEYRIRVCRDKKMSNIIEDRSTGRRKEGTITLDEFEKGEKYYWQIVALDSKHKEIDRTEIKQFTVPARDKLWINANSTNKGFLTKNDSLSFSTNIEGEPYFTIYMTESGKDNYRPVLDLIPEISTDSIYRFKISDMEESLKENWRCSWKVMSETASGVIESNTCDFWYSNFNEPPNEFELIAGARREAIDPIELRWHNRGDPDPPEFSISHYVMHFLQDGKTIDTISIYDIKGDIIRYTIDNPYEFFGKEGKIECIVTAHDSELSTRSKNKLEYEIKDPEHARLDQDKIRIITEYICYCEDDRYDEFIKTNKTGKQFDDYFTIALQSETKIIDDIFDFEYALSFYSRIGLGSRLKAIYHLRGADIALTSGIAGGVYGFGTEEEKGSFIKAQVGARKQFDFFNEIIVDASWIPFYRIPYKTIGDETLEFKALGWNAGIAIIVPKRSKYDDPHIMFEYRFEQILNEEHMRLRTHSVAVGYIF